MKKMQSALNPKASMLKNEAKMKFGAIQSPQANLVNRNEPSSIMKGSYNTGGMRSYPATNFVGPGQPMMAPPRQLMRSSTVRLNSAQSYVSMQSQMSSNTQPQMGPGLQQNLIKPLQMNQFPHLMQSQNYAQSQLLPMNPPTLM